MPRGPEYKQFPFRDYEPILDDAAECLHQHPAIEEGLPDDGWGGGRRPPPATAGFFVIATMPVTSTEQTPDDPSRKKLLEA